MRVADPVAELRPASAHFTYFRHNGCSFDVSSSLSIRGFLLQPICYSDWVVSEGASLTDFNHIHSRDGEDWVCGRSMSFHDEQMLHCEGRDPDEIEACRQCAERIIGYFGDPMHVH